MDNNYDEVTALPGIDTSAERERINYRPLNKEEERERRALIDEAIEDVVSETTPVESETILPTDLGQNMTELHDFIQSVKTSIEEMIQDVQLPIETGSVAATALTELGFTQNYLDAETYKTLLTSSKTPASEYLIQIWEDEAEDVEGTLAMEYYEDILEMEQDFNAFTEFTNETVFGVMGATFSPTEDFMKQLKDKQKRYSEAALNVQKEVVKLETSERNAFIMNDLAKVVLLKDESRLLRRKSSKYDNEKILINEGIEVTNEKLKNVYQSVESIKRNLKKEVYGTDSNYFSALFPYYESETELKQGLAKAKGLLKLSVDKQNEDKQELKDINRNHLSLEKRKRMQDTVLTHVEITDNWSEDWKELLLEQTTTTEEQDKFFDALTVGMHHSYEQRKEHTENFYRMSLQDILVRQQKIKQVYEKETARTSYKDIAGFIEHL